MNKISLNHVFIGLALFAFSTTVKAEAWLQIYKSENGFLFKGIAKKENFSFDVTGSDIATKNEGDRAFARIDNVLIQTFKAKSAAKVKPDPLLAYKESEMAYQQKLGAEVSNSNYCASLTHQHEEWKSTVKDQARSVTLVFKLKNSLLIVSIASEISMPEDAFLNKVQSICSTYQI